MDRGAQQSHPEDRKYLCRIHSCNKIIMRLYEIFETGKKQDLTPLRDKKCGLDESSPYII
jgi:hypothetical protein